ncbi:phosphoglycerol transferase MdoB-like AlkP superfamily enzyme [Paenibacillus sp. OAE614]
MLLGVVKELMNRFKSRYARYIAAALSTALIAGAVLLYRNLPAKLQPETKPHSLTQKEVKPQREKTIPEKLEELDRTYPFGEPPEGSARSYWGAGKGKNLIVVQLESFQNFVLNASVQGQKVAPVLKQLSKESLYFPYIFQQIGVGNTSDAEFAASTSIYPIGFSAMSTTYADRKLPSLAKLLGRNNYVTATFHVNDVTFWNRDQMYPALGFHAYYDKPYFSKVKFSRFGASDEELFRVGIRKMKTMRKLDKRFYAQFVTVTSHSPYKIKEADKRLHLPDDFADRRLGDYLTAVNYTDYALGTFIDKLKRSGLWDTSVVVIYGDHFGLHKRYHRPATVSKALGIPYHKHISTYNVPLIIHLPGQHEGKRIERTGGQIDILPTVANVMGIDLKQEKFTAFGHDLANVGHNIVGSRYYMPAGSFFNDDIVFVAGKNGFEDGKAYDLRTLLPVQNVERYRPDFEFIQKRMGLSDRYVKRLPARPGVKLESQSKQEPAGAKAPPKAETKPGAKPGEKQAGNDGPAGPRAKPSSNGKAGKDGSKEQIKQPAADHPAR